MALTYGRSGLVRFLARRRGLLSRTQGYIDEHYRLGQNSLVASAMTDHVRRGQQYFVRGWAFDFTRRQLAWDILVEIDRRVFPARTQLGLARPDVASTFDASDLLPSGFSFTFDTRSLTVGPHDLTVRVIVGRRGAAHAKIPTSIRFFVLDAHPPSLPRRADLADSFQTCHVDSVAMVPAGSVFEVSGWALDNTQMPIKSVAAQIDDNPWNEGWTGVSRPAGAHVSAQRQASAGFRVRMPLDSVEPGTHTFRLAGKGRDGRWRSLGQRTEFLVTTHKPDELRWGRGLIDSGQASIADIDGRPLTHIILYRQSRSLVIRGTLRRSTPLGPCLSLVAKADDNGADIVLPAWSAPTNDPTQLVFGAELSAGELPPNAYRLFVDAPDATQRFKGRTDTGCALVVRPNAKRASAQRVLVK